jgi:hypothetical protein
MSPADYAAWYGAAVSSAVAIASLISHRRRNTAVLRAVGDFHDRTLIANQGVDLRVAMRNVGGMPTTVTAAVPMTVERWCPTWLLRWTWARRLFGLSAAGGNQLRLGGSPGARTFVLAGNGGEEALPFISWPDDRVALMSGRYMIMVTHSAAMGRMTFVRLRHGIAWLVAT